MIFSVDATGNCIEGTWNLISKRSKLQLIYGDSAIAFDLKMLRNYELWMEFNDSTTSITWELVDAEGKKFF